MSRGHTVFARWGAVFTALLVLALAIAVYTPLHKHDPSNRYRCTLNNVDQAVAEAATPVQAILVVLLAVGLLVLSVPTAPVLLVSRRGSGRSPPSF